MDRCVNCGIATSGCSALIGPRALDDVMTLEVIRRWRAPQPVSSSDYICQRCWVLAQEPSVEAKVGHRNVCLSCGRSLASRVSHPLNTDSTREFRIYNVIREWVVPRTIEITSSICHRCWVAADRAAVRMLSGLSTGSQGRSREDVQTQVLPIESPNEEAQECTKAYPSLCVNSSPSQVTNDNRKRSMPNDMDNFMEYHVMGSVSQVRMKPGCIPTKFTWQSDNRKRPSKPKRPYIIPKRQKTLIDECINDLEETNYATEYLELGETSSESSISNENQENIAQEKYKTENEFYQAHTTHQFRSKDIQTEIELVNQTTSPVQPNLQSVCRVCLAVDVKMYDMRDFELSEMFQNITGIEITANAIMEHLCWECAARLKAAVSFRNKALLSDALLHGLVATGKEIQKADITLIKEENEYIKSNLSTHEVFHIVHIEENGEEEEQSPVLENVEEEIVQNTLTEVSIDLEGIKEENIESEITQNIISDTTIPEEESATLENIEIEQNRIPEESIQFEYNIKIKEEVIETEIENDDEPMIYTPIKTEDLEVDAFKIKEEEEEYIFIDPLAERKDSRGDEQNIQRGNKKIFGETSISKNEDGRKNVIVSKKPTGSAMDHTYTRIENS